MKRRAPADIKVHQEDVESVEYIDKVNDNVDHLNEDKIIRRCYINVSA